MPETRTAWLNNTAKGYADKAAQIRALPPPAGTPVYVANVHARREQGALTNDALSALAAAGQRGLVRFTVPTLAELGFTGPVLGAGDLAGGSVVDGQLVYDDGSGNSQVIGPVVGGSAPGEAPSWLLPVGLGVLAWWLL